MGKLKISKQKLDRFHKCAMPNLSGAPLAIKNAAFDEREKKRKELKEKQRKIEWEVYQKLHPNAQMEYKLQKELKE